MKREYLADCPDCQREKAETKKFATELAKEKGTFAYDELDNNQLLEKFTDALLDKHLLAAVDLRHAVLMRMAQTEKRVLTRKGKSSIL